MKPFSLLDQVLSESERKRMKFVGLKRTLKPRGKFTSLERKYYLMLKNLDVYYVPQYPMGGRYYDAYLPDQNILFEFDGSFWHPKNEDDAKYDFQKKAFKVDELKNKIQILINYPLISSLFLKYSFLILLSRVFIS